MFKKIFNREKKKENSKEILTAALLIHAAKIDENYSNHEKEIIKKALINLNIAKTDDVENIIKQAEKKEKECYLHKKEKELLIMKQGMP